MAFSEVLPLETVRNNALQLYQVRLTNWGNEGAGADANSLVSPIFDFSLAGLAIDPESLITSVVVRPVKGGVLNPSGDAQPDDFVISKEAPFTGRLTFPRIRPYNGKWGLVAFTGDRFGDIMTGQDGLAANFGTSVPQFRAPDLKVLMYIDAAPPPAQVPRRTPRRVTYSIENEAGPATVTIEPISGRRLVRVTVAPIAGSGHTIQIRGITPGPFNAEFAQLAADLVPGAVGAAGSVKSTPIIDPACGWLHLVATENSPGAISQIVVDMFDD